MTGPAQEEGVFSCCTSSVLHSMYDRSKKLIEFFVDENGFLESRTIDGSVLISTSLTQEIGSAIETVGTWSTALQKG